MTLESRFCQCKDSWSFISFRVTPVLQWISLSCHIRVKVHCRLQTSSDKKILGQKILIVLRFFVTCTSRTRREKTGGTLGVICTNLKLASIRVFLNFFFAWILLGFWLGKCEFLACLLCTFLVNKTHQSEPCCSVLQLASPDQRAFRISNDDANFHAWYGLTEFCHVPPVFVFLGGFEGQGSPTNLWLAIELCSIQSRWVPLYPNLLKSKLVYII